MVKYESQLDSTFSALADPTRRAILARLAVGDASVTELARPFDVSLPAVSKHLRVLERAGLLTQDRQGRVRRCQLQASPMRAAAEWIECYRRFWSQQLDALAEFFGESQDTAEARQEKRDNDIKRKHTDGI
ncbi:MAG: metalloregulator ArsR/SmtB family transcription factor [Phycisphaerales bacterium]|nr:metalloregulator ArsR/SmtB family transcription factor [Phycisphaerales bacterium]